MSVNIVDGIGRTILCKGCNQPLTLSSDDDYTGCINCRYPERLTNKKSVRDSDGDMPWYGWIFMALAMHFLL